MKRQAEADEFTHLSFREEVCCRLAIPSASYPLHRDRLEDILAGNGELAIDDLLQGLVHWLDVTDDVETPMVLARALLDSHCPADGRREGSCAFENEHGNISSFRIEPIDLDRPLVAWQRDDHVFAFGQPSRVMPGRLAIGAPGIFSLRVAQSIMNHAMLDFMNEPYDSFVGVHHSAGRTAAFYNREAGRTEIMPWNEGYHPGAGQGLDRGRISWLAPNQIARLVAIGNGYR